MQIYVSFRADDAAGFALNLRREWARLAPEFALVSGPVSPGEPAPDVPAEATISVLVGGRWLRSAPGEPSFLDDEGDPIRRLLEAALEDGRLIVPVLFRVSPSDWSAMSRDFPPVLQALAALNAVELRPTSFSQDLQRLIDWLRSPDRGWTEAESRSVIRVEVAGGGALKWWSGRDKPLSVAVDGSEVGSLSAWNGRLEWPVAPGRHKVQIGSGRLSPKSGVVPVEVAKGETVALVCDRNIFTGGVSLERQVR